MPQKGRKTPQGLSPAMTAATLLTGGLLAFGLCGAGLALSTALVLAGRLGEDVLLRCCCLSLGAGCFGGGLYAAGSCGCRMMAVSLGAGMVCFGIWAVIGLCCGGGISPALAGTYLLTAGAGSGCAGLLAVR